MKELLYHEPVIHCDETHLEVLNEPGRSAYAKSYVWVTASAEYQKEFRIALYHYSETRSDYEARRILKGYEGYVMCDGYAVYDSIARRGKKGEEPMAIQSVACLVHVRLKFTDALKLLKPEERYLKRLEQLKPALDAFFVWIETESMLALPKSKYGQAIEYARNQREKLNGLIPFEYLKYVLEVMPTMKLSEEKIDRLLPWSKELPSHIKTPSNNVDFEEEK